MRVADLIPKVTGSYPREFLNLIGSLDDQQTLTNDILYDRLWKAYQYSKNNHEGQLRK